MSVVTQSTLSLEEQMNHRLKGGSQKMMNLTVQWPWLIAWMVLSQSEGGDGGWRKGADVRAPPSSCPCGPWGTETPLGDKKGGPSFSARSLKTLGILFCTLSFSFTEPLTFCQISSGMWLLWTNTHSRMSSSLRLGDNCTDGCTKLRNLLR